MDDLLQHTLNKLTTAGGLASLSNVDDSVSTLRVQFPVTQILARVYASQLSSDQFVGFVYIVLKSASVEWLMSDQESQEESTADAAHCTADGTCERLYSDLSTALCKHACVQSLANEEEICEDLCKKLGEKAGTACTAMMTFSNLLGSLSSHNSCGQQSCRSTVRRVMRTLSCGAVLICLEHEEGCRWASTQSVKCSKQLMSDICSANGCDNTLESLLNADDGKFGFLQHILSDILPKLTRATWKLNLAAAYVFRRCLLATPQPLLSDFLPMLLPPVLLFVDDFEVCPLSWNVEGGPKKLYIFSTPYFWNRSR